MCQSLFGSAVKLKLEHIDSIRKLQHHIRTTDGTLHLHIYILPHQAEQQIEDGLIMLLGLVLQVVRDGGEERAGAFQTAFDVTFSQVSDEGNDIERVCSPLPGGRMWATGSR